MNTKYLKQKIISRVRKIGKVMLEVEAIAGRKNKIKSLPIEKWMI